MVMGNKREIRNPGDAAVSSSGPFLSLVPRCPRLARAALGWRMFARCPRQEQCCRVTGWKGLHPGRNAGVGCRKGAGSSWQMPFLFPDYREQGFFFMITVIIILEKKPSTGRGGLCCSHLSGFTPGTGYDTWNLEVQGSHRTWLHSVLDERENFWVTDRSLQMTCFRKGVGGFD